MIHSMLHTPRFTVYCLLSTVYCLLSSVHVIATTTNRWEFDDQNDYELSDSQLIEVDEAAGGRAQLRLQPTRTADADMTNILVGVSRDVQVGDTGNVQLEYGDSSYKFPAVLQSRVFDKGIAGGWQSIATDVENSVFLSQSLKGEVSTNSPGLVALYHLNNSYRDEVSGQNGRGYGGYSFVPASILGSHAGQGWNGRYFQTVNSTLLNGATEISIGFWIYSREESPGFKGIIGSSQGSTQFGVYYNNGSVEGGFVLPTGQSYAGSGANSAPLNSWSFIVMTWNGSTGIIKMYVNGDFRGQSGNYTGARGALPQTSPITINRFLLASADMFARLDEVSIWNRELSADEVSDLYLALESVEVRVRSGSAADLTGDFVGPDGTADSYYLSGYRLLEPSVVSPSDSYIQYQVSMYSDAAGSDTPYLHTVKLSTSDGVVVGDDTLGDYAQGESFFQATNVPAQNAAQFLGLRRGLQGVIEAGSYVSETLDARVGGYWDSIEWGEPDHTPSDTEGLEALWAMNEAWAPIIGSAIGAPSGGATFGAYPKFGSTCGMFDGVDDYVSFAHAGEVQDVELWFNSQGGNGGLFALVQDSGGVIDVTIDNNRLTLPAAQSKGAQFIVNGHRNRNLLRPGWNHAVLSLPAAVTVNEVRLGTAAGLPFKGLADDLALYSQRLLLAEANEHYIDGVPFAAGNVKLRVRTGNSLPLTGQFTGSGGNPGSHYGNGERIGLAGQRYLQYKLILEGDGSATPAVRSVRVVSSAGDFVQDSFEDFDRGGFGQDSVWYGDPIRLVDLASRGVDNLQPVGFPDLQALWHFDDDTWQGVGPLVEDSAGSRHGTALDGADTFTAGGIGAKSGSFDGSGDCTILPSISLAADFSVLGWFRSKSDEPAGLFSAEPDSGRYYSIELNSDGVGGDATGQVVFAVSGTVALSRRTNLNDDRWHHVAAVRKGSQLVLYLDGVRDQTVSISGLEGDVGSGPVYAGRFGASETGFLSGYLDELSVWTRALSPKEISSYAASGYDGRETGEFTSRVLDAGGASIWASMLWSGNGVFGVDVADDATGLAGLWHLDDVSGGLVDSGPSGLDADAFNLEYAESGIFSNAVRFRSKSSGYASVGDTDGLEEGVFTVAVWAYPESPNDRTVLDKRDGGSGYALTLDAQGYPVFWLSGHTCVAPLPVVLGAWTHLVGTYDGQVMRLYVDGRLVAETTPVGVTTATGSDFQIGRSYQGFDSFNGLLDEVAYFSDALTPSAIYGLYKSGRGTLGLQMRTSDDENMVGVEFLGPDGTSNSYYRVSEEGNIHGVSGLHRYFQYRAVFATEDSLMSPALHGVYVSASRYPDSKPWVAVNNAAGANFVGNLMGFNHERTQNTGTDVRYQITGDAGATNRWFYWNMLNNSWSESIASNTVNMYLEASDLQDVNDNIDEFYPSIYNKTGGVFRFKAFLESGGDQSNSVDWVEVEKSEGRVVVEVPNGDEVGDKAWTAGMTNDIEWSWAGVVGSNVVLEFSNKGPDVGDDEWTEITKSAFRGTNGWGSFSWETPTTLDNNPVSLETNMFIRISDPNDGSIIDMSDEAFELTRLAKLITPNGGELWYVGQTANVEWESTFNMGSQVRLHYAPDGVNYEEVDGGHQITNRTPNVSSQLNSYQWTIPTDIASLLSTNGKVRVENTSGRYTDTSDEAFTVAGIVISEPTAGLRVKQGETFDVQWQSVFGGSTVSIAYSPDGGTTESNLVSGVENVDGLNTWAWDVEESGTDNAMLIIRSENNANVIAYSQEFIVAKIDVIAPNGLEKWLAGTEKQIQWQAGGAEDKVNLYFRVDDSDAWRLIEADVDNVSGGASNAFTWSVSELVSPFARVKIEAVVDTNLFAISQGPFNIAGVRVTSPNGQADSVERGVPFEITHDFAPDDWEDALVEISYDEGVNFTNISAGGIVYGLGEVIDFVPTIPSRRAKVKVSARTTPGFTNIYDESDDFFTVKGVLVNEPVENAEYTIGTQNPVRWLSAGADETAMIYYAPEGDTNNLILLTPDGVNNNLTYPGETLWNWTVPSTIEPAIGATVTVTSGGYTDTSDPFTVRGIRFVAPVLGDVWDTGTPQYTRWKSAAIDHTAKATIELSLDGGVTWPVALATNQSLVDENDIRWSIPADLTPTTNAVLQLTVTDSDVVADRGMVVKSDLFTLRGLLVEAPTNGAAWNLGTTEAIKFTSAAMGDTFTISYSVDGGTSYDPVPIAEDLALGDGSHAHDWNIELDREPSANAVIRVAASGGEGLSGVFALNGIRVDRPFALDIWAAGDTNTIEWIGEGTSDAYDIDLTYADGRTPLSVHRNVPGSNYDWGVPANAIPNGDVVSNVVMRVRDHVTSSIYGESEPFTLVIEPMIVIEEPKKDAFLKVGEDLDIEWIKGGQLDAGDFSVMFEYGPGFSVVDEIDEVPTTYDPDRNLFVRPWGLDGVPDDLGPARVVVTSTRHASVFDTSEVFYIAPNFEVVWPNGTSGEDPIYANQPVTVSWLTWGSVDRVNLFYSTNSGPWVLIASDVENNSSAPPAGREVSTYRWEVPTLSSGEVKFRVQDASYGTTSTFDGVTPGPYDDSDDFFALNYYTILWEVGYDDDGEFKYTDQLSVTDSSGWSESGLTSIDEDGDPVMIAHAYPYGVYDTVWYRQFFNDSVDFRWLCDSNQTRRIVMQPSDTEPDAHVLANFVYVPLSTNETEKLIVHSWIERGGRVLHNPDSTTVYIYDTDGSEVKQLYNSDVLAEGFFRMEWPNVTAADELILGETYPARVEVVYNGVTFSAGVTYSLSLGAEATSLEALQTNLRNLSDTVTNQVGDLATLTEDFRDSALGRLGSLSNQVESVGIGVSNIEAQVNSFTNTIMAPLAALSNQIVDVIAPTLTNVAATVSNISDNTSGDSARILNRPTTVENGSTNTILYKTTRSLDYGTVTVSEESTGDQFTMTEVTTGLGIYSYDLIADWGTGSFTVTCSDPNASDGIVLEVVTSGISSIAEVAETISEMESQMSGMSSVLDQLNTSGLGSLLDSIGTEISQVESAIASASGSGNGSGNGYTDQLESLIAGAGSDDSGLMAELSGMSSLLSEIYGDASSASKFALSAKTEAGAAASGIQELKTLLAGGGDAAETTAKLAAIKSSIDAANANISDIPTAVGATALHAQMREVAKQISEMASSEGYDYDVGLMAAGGEGGDAADEEMITVLNQNMSEMKISLEFMQKILDEKINEPVVHEAWLGVE